MKNETDQPAPPPIVWTIAGSDSGGGAGIQADLKTFQALEVHGCSVITALTAQNTQRMTRTENVSPGMIEAQLLALQEDLAPVAIKIGMLGNATTIKVVSEFLQQRDTYVVCDPVMVATQGGNLLEPDAFHIFRESLLPRVDLLTPNLDEAGSLLGRSLDTPEEVERGAHELLTLGPKAMLIKGGHGCGERSADFWTNGQASFWVSSPRQGTTHTHGGGCTLSAAIAAGHALGLAELDAIVLAKAYLNHGLRLAQPLGRGRNPLAHGHWPDDPADLPLLTLPGEKTLPHLHFPDLGKEPLGLYPIVDRADWIERLLALGVNMIQLRVKDMHGVPLENEVRRAIEAGRQAGARIFINDHWELALRYGAYGVHLGQDDLPTTDLRALAEAGLRLGISTHGYAEVARALAVRPSYVAIGTLFASPSKTFAHQPMGLTAFTRLRKLIAEPVIAIGGITVERAPEVLRAGANGLAVISDITKAVDLAARVRQWQALWRST
jgi:hydroxymethylpyrimidine kinase/phosphomethylpyrimidine kinase/thiamine-phosphate diphosphorylase